jgi:hypothetical protein
MKLHAESLLRIPLVRNLQKYPLFPRGVDHHWYYQKATPSTMSGFQPFSGKIYYGKNSYFAQWQKAPEKSARLWNVNDNLVKEVMFAVHDSLHLWAVGAIQKLRPELGFGTKPIDRKNFEDLVFCHLLTEAVAVCGLDYWYLSTVNLNSICAIGTNFQNLTVNYREEDLPEFRRFHPQFRVQSPQFLWQLTQFYCSGIFPGFSVEDLKQSPKLLTWLSHELRYGQNQRRYARDWFAFLSRDPHIENRGEEAVSTEEGWKAQLTKEVGKLLWLHVKGPKRINFFPSRWNSFWKAPAEKRPDFRFINLNSGGRPVKPSAEDFEFYFYQEMVRRKFDAFPAERANELDEIRKSQDWPRAKKLFGALPLVAKLKEPRDLFVLP